MLKKYLITIIIQVLTLTIFVVCCSLLFNIERVVLSPILYLLPVGVMLLLANIILVILLFRNKIVEDEDDKNV